MPPLSEATEIVEEDHEIADEFLASNVGEQALEEVEIRFDQKAVYCGNIRSLAKYYSGLGMYIYHS